MSIFLFLLVLIVLILVHELGHFLTAKWTGMRVDEFGIGFPPRIWGKRVGETLYSINALPIGGFVRIFGEDASEVSDASDRDRSFAAQSKRAQAVVLLAGVTMNILFAWLLFVGIFSLGVPAVVDEAEATKEAKLLVADVMPESPAASVLRAGAIITGVNDSTDPSLLTPSGFQSYVRNAAAEPLTLTVEQGGTESTVTIVPEQGLVSSDPELYAIGIAPVLIETQRQSFPGAVVEATVTTVTSLKHITVGLAGLVQDIFIGQADFSQVTGPVGIVGLVGDAADFGFTSLLMFTAIISLNLAVINLLPFPALDGGRLVFVMIESVTGRTISPVWTARVNLVGFMLLMLLMVAVTYNDILRLL